jgi:hypothetical protein
MLGVDTSQLQALPEAFPLEVEQPDFSGRHVAAILQGRLAKRQLMAG